VDDSAGQTLESVHGQPEERHTRLVFAEVDSSVRQEPDRFGIVALVGADAFFDTLSETVEAYRAATGSPS
jgi:hypothetical protein